MLLLAMEYPVLTGAVALLALICLVTVQLKPLF